MTLNGNALGKAASKRVHEYTHVGITVDAYVNISSFSINRMNKATVLAIFSSTFLACSSKTVLSFPVLLIHQLQCRKVLGDSLRLEERIFN